MISERIKERRRELGLTQADVARALKITKTAVSLWESGTNTPNGSNILALSKTLKCEPSWLLTGKTTSSANKSYQADSSNVRSADVKKHEAEYAGDFDTWDSKTPLGEDEVEIPFYKEVELAAGNGMIVEREDTGRKLRFAKSTLRRAGVDPAAAACVTVTGDSMKPVLPDGATIGIDTSSKRIKDGEMYAIDHDGQLRVKVLHRVGGSGIRLRSFNTTDFPDEDYQADQAKAIKVIGRVFWYSVLR
ncbi:S24 family peptidase [Aliidiomarina sp. Khilg15.8]